MKNLRELVAEGVELLQSPDVSEMRSRHADRGTLYSFGALGEVTVAANVGYYEKPFGPPLTAPRPQPLADYEPVMKRARKRRKLHRR